MVHLALPSFFACFACGPPPPFLFPKEKGNKEANPEVRERNGKKFFKLQNNAFLYEK